MRLYAKRREVRKGVALIKKYSLMNYFIENSLYGAFVKFLGAHSRIQISRARNLSLENLRPVKEVVVLADVQINFPKFPLEFLLEALSRIERRIKFSLYYYRGE